MTENWRKWRWKEISPFSVNGDWTTTKNQTKRQEKNWEHKNGQVKRRRKRKETDHRKKERKQSKAKKKEKKKKKKKKSTARGIPRRSPIQVLTSPDVAWLRWSDENRYFQRGMAVDIWHTHSHQLIPKSIQHTTPALLPTLQRTSSTPCTTTRWQRKKYTVL